MPVAGGGSTGLMPTSIACTDAPQARAITQLAAKPARMDSNIAEVTACIGWLRVDHRASAGTVT